MQYTRDEVLEALQMIRLTENYFMKLFEQGHLHRQVVICNHGNLS